MIVLMFLCLYYNSNYQSHLEYPDSSLILKDYPLGGTVSVSGVVTNSYNDGFLLSDNYHGTAVNYHVLSNQKLEVGDEAEVLGTLIPNYTIKSSKILVITKFDYEFMLLRSFLVVIIFILLFRRYWRFNISRMEFRRVK
ncbi:hypothetical protein [Methanobacterium congolense]|uniref:Nucleic acid binding OB-fold tRNA/helicase-type n=1 Tax=Methanobacterium congolense TaxID=118062 RepID=A0A1D3L2J7_9EURY|nr:hypothetical protein [Methanobacterium congolense]SCG85841.1 Nucleic acid binding OB-fold tRNA/helicase-type [Methanobacterium congolense]